ncbi:MAG: UDP-N-acetylglucosamine 2-epimerase (non-hydrolyzing) [Bacteroidales bacterium]|nr:UDP-N-acetylglucosamine 2-epimerase (non-hydrolyzing) [Bacteroidales bacterium]
MKTILLVFGTRPEAIKMCPLIKALQQERDHFRTLVCVTGQHRELLDQVLEIFDVVPDYDLNIMQPGQDLYDITARVLAGMRTVLKEVKPDWVLVHGDTTTSTSAALAAFYQKIPVGHIEAGLRTGDIYSPWPEEMNRQLTGRIASCHFAPTELCRQNLLLEGVSDDKIVVTGNTVIDALLHICEILKTRSGLREEIKAQVKDKGYPVDDSRRLVLITGHRRENFGEGFLSICRAIRDLAARYPDVDFLYPMHLNPNVRTPIREVFGDNSERKNVYFTEPLDYLDFVYLMMNSYFVLTDSGGIQEEAPGLGKPVLVMRNTTERPEAVAAGTVKLVGADYDTILSESSLLLDNREAYMAMSRSVNPYGDGKACERIVSYLRDLDR